MVRDGRLLPTISSATDVDIAKNRAEMRSLIKGAYDSCINPDSVSGRASQPNVIIGNPPSFGSPHCAEALGVPYRTFSP